MWKYILIVLFLLLAIREINLMNQSLYVTSDNKIVAEDKTTATEFKKLIDKLEHNEFLLSEPDTIAETNISTEDSAAKETVEIDEINLSTPTISEIKLPEENLTKNNSELAADLPPEENLTKAKIKTETNNTKTVQEQVQKPMQPEITSVETEKPAPVIEHTVIEEPPQPVKKTTLQIYPKNFQSAEEKVQAILRQMRQR